MEQHEEDQCDSQTARGAIASQRSIYHQTEVYIL